MDWRKYLDLEPVRDPTMTNPVGTSTMQRVTNPSPDVSPLVSAMLMTPEQRVGAFYALGTRRAKPWTGRDLPELSKLANEAYDYAAGFVNSSQPIRAYHGSPHTFDRFDLSKIGTGEGAQAYGHGLYFAEREGIAKSYRDALTSGADNWSVNGRSLGQLYTSGAPGARLDYELGIAARQGRSVQEAIDYVLSQRQAQLTSKRLLPEDVPFLREDIAALQAMKAKPPIIAQNPGSMYEVNLRTSPERLLDWDKPLSQQPAAVREALGKAGVTVEQKALDAYDNALLDALFNDANAALPKQPANPTGADIYNRSIRSAARVSNPQDAASALRDLGIDGIQYLDAGSRAAGDGTRNYVMFDDKLIDIIRRYGLFGLGMTGGAMGAAQTYAPQGAEQ